MGLVLEVLNSLFLVVVVLFWDLRVKEVDRVLWIFVIAGL